MARLNAANNAESVLAQAVSVDELTIVVADASVFPDAPFKLSIENEILEVTEVVGNSFTVLRGQENTTIGTYAVGTLVENKFTAGSYNELVSKEEFGEHQAERATETTLGHVKVATEEDGTLLLDASNISTSDGSDVQSEIDNLKSSVSDGKNQLETVITDKKGVVSKAGEVATFPELVEGVGSIPSAESMQIPNNTDLFNMRAIVIDESGNYYTIEAPSTGKYVGRIRDKNFTILKEVIAAGVDNIYYFGKTRYGVTNGTGNLIIYDHNLTQIKQVSAANIGSYLGGALTEDRILFFNSNSAIRLMDYNSNILSSVTMTGSDINTSINKKGNFVVRQANYYYKIDKETYAVTTIQNNIYFRLLMDTVNW
jgi:hypothetical protein